MAGYLVGPQWDAEQVVELAYHADPEWEIHDNLVMAATICFAECDGYINSFHDNNIALSQCKVGDSIALNTIFSDPTKFTAVTTASIKYTVVNPNGLVKNIDGNIISLKSNTQVTTSRDVGMWQINIPSDQISTKFETELYDPNTNIARAVALWKERKWEPWTSYVNGITFDDRYFITASLGVLNYSIKILKEFQAKYPERKSTHLAQSPFLTIPQVRKLYPDLAI